jgi:ADP-ribose pyrophosphatase
LQEESKVEYHIGESTVIFDEFFRIEKAQVSWERWDGSMGKVVTRYVVRRGDSVGIIPVREDTGEIALVRQFRYPACGRGGDGYLWEIPAGMLGSQEDREKAARRELEEEIGVEPAHLQYLMSFFLSPGAIDERFHLFLANMPEGPETGSVGGNREEEEDLLIGLFDKQRLFSMMEGGQIIDAKTIASILFYFSRGRKGDTG